ncbi:MAG: S-layer homology domain-containing protein, partial [Oscillospiraceae bacterium]
IDAFTGKESTIWEDMKAAEGTRYYGGWDCDDAVAEECDSDEGLENPATGSVNFTPAELEKIQKDNNLIKTDKAFEMLKTDKLVALTDDYKLKSYEIYSTEDVKTGDETFYLDLRYAVKDELKENYKSYTNINVRLNAETGEVLYLNRYGNKADLPKLDVAKAKGIAESVAKTYSKDIFTQYKADKSNSSPVSSWTSGGKTYYESERSFAFNRFVNGIQVTGDQISVSVDSNGVVTSYSVNHTEDVTFVPNNILGKSEAFDKLYDQQAFEYYYDGWITKDGKVKTYLIYKMDSFYLNANTGKLCSWSGTEPYTYVSAEDVKYSDIKGIKQEEAIRALQKYGVVLTTKSKFEPDKLITEDEFMNLVTSALGGYSVAYEDEVEVEYVEEDMTLAQKTEAEKKAEAEKKDKAETTVKEAAVMFGKLYLSADIAKLNIFKSPFSDVKNSDEDAGYIAVANAKGFITGENGKLNGEKTITRAEAAQIIYDYLKFLSK